MHAKMKLIVKVIQGLYVAAWIGLGVYMIANHTFPIVHSETAAAAYIAITILSSPLGALIFIPATVLIGTSLNALSADLNVQVVVILVLGFVLGAAQWFLLIPWLIRKKWGEVPE